LAKERKHIILYGDFLPSDLRARQAFNCNYASLLDADIVMIGKSNKKICGKLKLEIFELLNQGKTVFIFLYASNINVIELFSIEFKKEKINTYIFVEDNDIFENFNREYSEYISVEGFIEIPSSDKEVIFKHNSEKILGAQCDVSKKRGDLIFLPAINLQSKNLGKLKSNGYFKYNDEAKTVGSAIIKELIEIDDKLKKRNREVESTRPEWLDIDKYKLTTEISIDNQIKSNISKVEELGENLIKEQYFQKLLYEKGSYLEAAVNKSLSLLGYEFENYPFEESEIGHILKSPEGDILISKSKGKNEKPINTKSLGKLNKKLSEYYDIDNTDNNICVLGVLFGNGFRLTQPDRRDIQFTTKALRQAMLQNSTLVQTSDLFPIVNYLRENDDDDFKFECRKAIKKYRGKIVEFPKVPENQKKLETV
jgi:hypothetical protein